MLTNIANFYVNTGIAKHCVALACCGVLLWNGMSVWAEEIGKVNFNNHAVTLTGDRLSNGFCRDFLMKVDRESAPYWVNLGVEGGYWPELKILQLKPEEKQLFFTARQGGENATTEYRIFAERKGKITSIFSGTESLGLIQKVALDENKLQVQLLDGTQQSIPLPDKIWEKIENFYNRGYEPNYQGLYSLVAYDSNGDGVEELYAAQRIELNNVDLGYVAAQLEIQTDDSWKMSHYVLQMPSVPKEGDRVNVGTVNDFYEIYPEKIYIPHGQCAYPHYYTRDKQLQQKINALIGREYAQDLRELFTDKVPMGFETVLSFEKICSLRFIGGKVKRNHFLHFDPLTGKEITLRDMFKISKPMLAMMTKTSPSKHKYQEKDLQNWFMKDTTITFVLEENGKQRAEEFKLGTFEKYLSPKNTILQKKN